MDRSEGQEVVPGRHSYETSPTLSSRENEPHEKDSFLGGSDEPKQTCICSRPLWRRMIVPACIHIAIFLVYFTLATVAIDAKYSTSCRKRFLIHSPVHDDISWEVQRFNSGNGHEGPYSGYPRPDLEKAWEDLLGPMNVRFSEADMEAVGRTEDAVQLPDGSGFAGTLNVYHEIHCVRWMHVYMYQEHYYPDLDDKQREKNRLHSEHCLNHLRKSAMCHGDVGIVTYNWGANSRKPYAAATTHQCVNWQALSSWAEAHRIDMFKPGLLVHPTLGDAYKEGEGKSLME